MSEMRPVTDKEVRDAAERLRQTRAAEDATDAAGVEAGYELGVRWACEIAGYDELKSYAGDDASKTPTPLPRLRSAPVAPDGAAVVTGWRRATATLPR